MGVYKGAAPGSQKEAEITNRDSEICPGNRINRLPSSPGHQLRIGRTLQCLTGMRPHRDSDISTEVWDSPRDQYYFLVLDVADYGIGEAGMDVVGQHPQ